MLDLNATLRQKTKKGVNILRKEGVVPAVLYGPGLKSLNLQVNKKDFETIYKSAGENTLVNLCVKGHKEKFLVLIQYIQKDPISGEPFHADFYQPKLTEKIEVDVPIIFEGEAPAVKELSGTLIKNINELSIKALPQNLLKEIQIDVSSLKTFEDAIMVKNLRLPEGIEILNGPDEIIAKVVEPEKVEEELEKPIEEKVEEVRRVEKERREEQEEAAETEEKT